MIIGLGTDIIDIKRFEKTLQNYGDQFINRLFTTEEQFYCNQKPQFRVARYAKRFAAKEAALKALGTGRSQGITWHDVAVQNLSSGKPTLIFSGVGLSVLTDHITKTMGQQLVINSHLSLSDTDFIATATVIIEALAHKNEA